MKKLTRITDCICCVCGPKRAIKPRILEDFILYEKKDDWRFHRIGGDYPVNVNYIVESIFYCSDCGIVYRPTTENKLEAFKDTNRVVEILFNYVPIKIKSHLDSFPIFPEKMSLFESGSELYSKIDFCQEYNHGNFFLIKDTNDDKKIIGKYNLREEKKKWDESFSNPIEQKVIEILGKHSEKEVARATAFLKKKLPNHFSYYDPSLMKFKYVDEVKNPKPFKIPTNLIPALPIYLFNQKTLKETEYFIALDALEEIPKE